MGFERGRIYLANFNPSKGTEAGKVRPCLVIQSNLLNDIDHPSTTVIPLTTQVIQNAEPLRVHLNARDKLISDSDIMIDQVRTIDNARIRTDSLTGLTARELVVVEEYLNIVLGLNE